MVDRKPIEQVHIPLVPPNDGLDVLTKIVDIEVIDIAHLQRTYDVILQTASACDFSRMLSLCHQLQDLRQQVAVSIEEAKTKRWEPTLRTPLAFFSDAIDETVGALNQVETAVKQDVADRLNRCNVPR